MYKLLATLMIFASSLIYAEITYPEITYPEYYYVIDKETNFRIVLGGVPEFVKIFYGPSLSKKLLLEATSPDYEIWREKFECGLILEYETYDFMISAIRIDNDRFITSMGLGIGSTRNDIIKLYGEPTRVITRDSDNGIIKFLYESDHKEINLDGEYSLIEFTLMNDIVTRIILEIVSSV